jgi:hypothetical protein
MNSEGIFYKKKKDKSGGEMAVDDINKEFFNLLLPYLGEKATYDYQLNDIGKTLFKDKFRGVMPMSQTPILEDDQCCIVNTNAHWVALYFKNGILYIYDSFGRKYKKLFNNILKDKYPLRNKIVQTDNDAEQNMKDETCGVFCLSWLCVVYNLGIDKALLI